MDSIAPRKAAPIIAAEVETSPRLSRKIIVRDTASFAPEEMPSTKGPAMGLAKKVWSRKPDRDRPPPRIAAASIRGALSLQTMASSACRTLPTFRFSAASRASSPTSSRKARAYLRRGDGDRSEAGFLPS